VSIPAATKTMLESLGFSDAVEAYLLRGCGIESLKEIAYLDGEDDVENTIKGVTSPEGTVNIGIGTSAVTSSNNGILFSIRSVANLKLCVYYLNHMEIVQRKPVVTDIDLELVRVHHDHHICEAKLKKTAVEPVINEKDWPRTLENIKEYLASQYGGIGATLEYVIRAETTVKPEAYDHVEDYDLVDQEMTVHVPHSRQAFVNDRHKVWDIMSNIFCKHFCFVYIKPALQNKNGRDAYMLLFDHFLGPNNVGNMASSSETNLTGTL
jgi:hypothetical protein